MTAVELFKSRYKVIAKYPFSPLRLNQIVEGEAFNVSGQEKVHMADFPVIFEKMNWWERRNLHLKEVEADVIKIVPYLKANSNLYGGLVCKVTGFTAELFGYMSGVRDAFISELPDSYGKKEFPLRFFEPATELEYHQYIQKQKTINL
jgi:hypothetical protein